MQTQKQHDSYRNQNQDQSQHSGNVGANRVGGGNGYGNGNGNGNGGVNAHSQFQRERAGSQAARPIAEYSQSIGTPAAEGGGMAANPPSSEHPPSRSPSLSPSIRFTQAPPTSTSPSPGFHNPWVAQQSRPRIPPLGRTTSHPAGSGNTTGAGGGIMSGLGFLPHNPPIPTRSSSFSAASGSSATGSSYQQQPQQSYLSTVRDNLRFTSTFEDDEFEALSDSYSFDEVSANANTGANGRGGHQLYPQAQYGTDSARSRSQSLLVPPSPASAEFGKNWRDTPSGSTTTTARPSFSSSDFLTPAAPTAIPGRSMTQTADISNISPFRRDIHQILMGDSSTLASHSIGAGGHHHGRPGVGLGTLGPPGAPSVLGPSGHRDDPLGGTSGTTSRRHSMSIYHPRRDIYFGFQTSNNSMSSAFEDAASSSSTAALTPSFRSNVLSDEELASGLGGSSSGMGGITTGLQNFNMSASAPGYAGMQSQPSSLPNFTRAGGDGLLGSPEHSRFLSGASPGASARGLSPHRPSISPSLSRTSGHLDAVSDRATSVSPRSDVGAFGVGGLGLGNTNAMGMGMPYNPYGRFVSPEMEYGGGLSPPGTGPGAGRYLPPNPGMLPPPSLPLPQTSSLSMYPNVNVPGAGSAGMFAHGHGQPTSPVSTNFTTPTRFGHTHSSSLGLASMRGLPSINAAMGGAGGNNGPTSPHSPSSDELNDLGRGVPLHAVPSSYQLFIVEFKAGRTDLFYTTDRSNDIRLGDLVIVEADRGKDLGKIINDTITTDDVEAFQRAQQIRQAQQLESQFTGGEGGGGGQGSGSTTVKRDINPKRIYAKASLQDTQLLAQKLQDEMKALQLCQTKVRAKKLPMEVVDAEYQWDRRKLTFYFVAEKRIDFRELVRELFRLYKTRIWMASLQAPHEPAGY